MIRNSIISIISTLDLGPNVGRAGNVIKLIKLGVFEIFAYLVSEIKKERSSLLALRNRMPSIEADWLLHGWAAGHSLGPKDALASYFCFS